MIKSKKDNKPSRIFSRDYGVFNTSEVWALIKNEKIHNIDLDLLVDNLDKDYWCLYEGCDPIYVSKIKQNETVTPKQIINRTKYSEYHSNRINKANLSYPIIVILDENKNLDVLDGLHRLSKAYMKGIKKIKAQYVTMDILNKAKIK